jgi:hypothetical protein
MLKLSLRKKPSKAVTPTICMAHRNNLADISSSDKSPFVRKDVFAQYAQRMDERCGNHENMIGAVGKKIDKLNQLFVGLLVSLLIVGIGFKQTLPKPHPTHATARSSLIVLTKRIYKRI